jgi:hypothetical protein
MNSAETARRNEPSTAKSVGCRIYRSSQSPQPADIEVQLEDRAMNVNMHGTGGALGSWCRGLDGRPTVFFLGLLVAGLVTVHSTTDAAAGPCSSTATAARTACKGAATEDYWNQFGACLNIGDGVERKACKKDASATRTESNGECNEQFHARRDICDMLGEAAYEPSFDPANFVDPDDIGGSVTPNPYFPLVVGYQWIYEGAGETITFIITDKTKLIEGVTCRVARDTVTVDGFITEDTDDWFAQDDLGNVWYCGESTQTFETFAGDNPVEEELTGIEGAWKAGRDLAKPGIIFLASPSVGDVYREEFMLNNAEDVAEIVSTTASATVPAASCSGTCVETRNFTSADPGVEEFKYYAPGVGFILEITPEGERIELTSFTQ